MPVFGSMTSNTEFEFLTGDSMALLPANSIAYQFNVKPGTYSMVSTLKDQGYYSVAMHPYPGENWNRVECYQNMGFDAFLDQEFYEGSEELRNYVSDEADYQKLIQVVEAKEKSGTMSTVGHAERYGKPVFAVPGSIFSPASAGTNALLRDGRAKAVCTAADLFGTLGLQNARPAPAPRETPRPLSENERLVLSCLGAKAQGVEELGVKSGLPTAALLGVLMKLELAGRVSCLPGKRYILRGGSAS